MGLAGLGGIIGWLFAYVKGYGVLGQILSAVIVAMICTPNFFGYIFKPSRWDRR